MESDAFLLRSIVDIRHMLPAAADEDDGRERAQEHRREEHDALRKNERETARATFAT